MAANRYMERGNVVEFRGEADPESFRLAFSHLKDSIPAIERAIEHYDALLGVLEEQPVLPVFAETLAKLYGEAEPFERITGGGGGRYSDLGVAVQEGAAAPAGTSFADLQSVLKAQQEDMRTFLRLTERTVEAFQGVLPLTEKGEFVAMMLSGRSPFSDYYEELVHARSTLSHFYTEACMVSIQAVMQTYPAGFEFLTDRTQATQEPPRSNRGLYLMVGLGAVLLIVIGFVLRGRRGARPAG